MVKKGLMVQLWRIQQSQTVISLFFWALTLAGIFYLNYFKWMFVQIGLVKDEQNFLGTVYLFLIIIVAFLLLGLLYDRVLRLWREQMDVAVERNPYSKERLMPKEIVFWQRGTVSIMRELAKKDPSIQEDIDFVEKWIQKSLSVNKELRAGAKEIEEWVNS